MQPDQKRTVLVVDDEEPLRKLTRLILEQAGYRVLVASNGREAQSISRDYCAHIDLLFSDVEMPGIDGITLAHQVTADRPGISVLLSSANPAYVEKSNFALLPKPFTPANLKTAIAQMLESYAQACAHQELKPILPQVTVDPWPGPEIVAPKSQRAAADAAWVWQESPFEISEDQAGQHSRKLPAQPERKLPEAAVLIRGNDSSPSEANPLTARTTVHKLTNTVGERTSRWRIPHAVPVWAAAAALVLAIVPFSLNQRNGSADASPYTVSLRGMRGPSGEAEAPTGQPFLLILDVSTLPRSNSYEVQIVDAVGISVWQKSVPAQGSEVRTKAAALRAGIYFVRVYGPAGELLKEYELRVKETL